MNICYTITSNAQRPIGPLHTATALEEKNRQSVSDMEKGDIDVGVKYDLAKARKGEDPPPTSKIDMNEAHEAMEVRERFAWVASWRG